MNKFSKILVLIATSFIWMCFFSSVFGVEEYTLEVLPGITHKIVSAYPYKHLSEEEKAKAYTVTERTYVILDAGTGTGELGSTNIAIIPNLNPCICIVIHYGNRVAVFHHHFSSSIKDLITKTRTRLGINEQTNPREIKIYIYAFEADNFKSQWQKRYQGRTQKAELVHIKKILMQQLGITNDDQVESCLWTPNIQDYENYGNYYGLDTSIVVSISDKNELTIYNTSLVHEEVFFQNNYSEKHTLHDTILRHRMTKIMQSYIFSKYQDALLKSPKYEAFYNAVQLYGKMPYMRALPFTQHLSLIDTSELAKCLGSSLFQLYNGSLSLNIPDVQIEAQSIPCYVCGKVNEKVLEGKITNLNKKCARCEEYYYCSQECQKLHWFQQQGGHKSECRKLKFSSI